MSTMQSVKRNPEMMEMLTLETTVQNSYYTDD